MKPLVFESLNRVILFAPSPKCNGSENTTVQVCQYFSANAIILILNLMYL